MNRTCALLAVLLFFVAAPAAAQTSGTGLGGTIGVSNASVDPVGLSVKAWVTDRQAFQGAASFVISDEAVGASYLVLQSDFLFHNFEQVAVGSGLLALYVGPGLQVTFIEDADNRLAFRAPLGINYMFDGAPVDIFAEVAPALQIAPDAQLRFDGALGFRYFL